MRIEPKTERALSRYLRDCGSRNGFGLNQLRLAVRGAQPLNANGITLMLHTRIARQRPHPLRAANRGRFPQPERARLRQLPVGPWPADTSIADLCSGYLHLCVTKTHASVNVHISAFDTSEGNAAAIDIFHDHYGPSWRNSVRR